ncbi:MAG: VCBS repeat-containing protein [Krumholzibacteria bacterium]|nr:VCBS repeat-containing protein [Candidatus Krumholzibacteria bacterium]
MHLARRPTTASPVAPARTAMRLFAAACLAAAAAPATAVVVEFPGPVPVVFTGSPRCAVAVDLGESGERLVVGTANRDLSLVRYNVSAGAFTFIERLGLEGEPVALLPLRDPAGAVTALLAATRDPDRIVTVRVGRSEPFLTITATLDLEEDPGALALLAADLAAVSLPGVDRLVWLAATDGVWRVTGESDAGDRPGDLAAADLDGDGTAELVVANAGALSRSLMVFRRGDGGYVLDQDLPLPGAPTALAAGDVDGDGRDEVAVSSADTALVWLLQENAGMLAEVDRVETTVAADGVHLAALPGGNWGLYPSSSARGLLEYYRNDAGDWSRRDGYYPGCRPAAVLTADLNGDGVPDLVSVGGASRVVTVMFGSPDLNYWGFPALALPGRPGGLSLGDFDGNGLNDVVVMSADSGTLGFFRGRADGGVVIAPEVQELFLLPGAMTAIAADDRPGPELAVHDRLGGAVRILTRGQAGWETAASTPLAADVRRLAAGDVDGDGFADLVVLTGTAPEVRVLFGAGDGTFPDSVHFGFENRAVGIAAVDLDADGLLDLVGVDSLNRVWIALNGLGRDFSPGGWINAGSGSRSLALGDLDGDGDADLVVAGQADETLTFLQNTGTGVLNRLVGSLVLGSRPEGVLVEDVNQDGINDVIVNLRDAGTIAVVYGLGGWAFTPPVSFAAGGDVAYFATGDFNTDLVPDILTLDASLRLGLTMLNVERGLVSVALPTLAADCADGQLVVEIRPAGRGPWRLDLVQHGQARLLASDAGAQEGILEAGGGSWTWRGAVTAAGAAELRLAVGADPQAAVLHLPAAGCGASGLQRASWARNPWPNPFNPVVDARFTLWQPARVTAAVYDLRGRLVATLLAGALPAGEHGLHWDGRRGGRPAEAGAYLLRIRGEGFVLTEKLVLLK